MKKQTTKTTGKKLIQIVTKTPVKGKKNSGQLSRSIGFFRTKASKKFANGPPKTIQTL